MRETHSLFGRLARCPPPGCQYQKYLRWLRGQPADSAIVRRVLVGVSMLAPTFREMTETSQIKPNRVCFTEQYKTILTWLFPKDEEDSRGKEIKEKVWKFFNFSKFKLLVESVIESNQCLRLVMAEYHQIECRGAFGDDDDGFLTWRAPSSFLHQIETGSPGDHFQKHGRQMGALLDLIMLNNQAPGIHGFWA